jgi:hypothetical protein
MLGNVPDLLIDLLEVASYVYCADQRLRRGSDKLTNFGEDWRRSLHFSIPVRQLNAWQDPGVQDQLVKTLGFLSDDSYEFSFRQAEAPAQPKELYFSDLIDTTSPCFRVASIPLPGPPTTSSRWGSPSRWLGTTHRRKSVPFKRS